MQKQIAAWLALFVVLAFGSSVFAQDTTQPSGKKEQPGSNETKEAQEKNISKYIELLRSDVRQDKAEIMGALMQLSADEAAKFWPVYNEYDAALRKLNDLRVANIQDYARNYDKLSDDKADELIQNALHYQQQRSELLAKYYGRVKESIGAIDAARFVQIENQLLLIIDLRIASSLPVAPKEATNSARR